MYDNIQQALAKRGEEARGQVVDGYREAGDIKAKEADDERKRRLKEYARTVGKLEKLSAIFRAYQSIRKSIEEYPKLIKNVPLKHENVSGIENKIHFHATMIILYSRILEDLEAQVSTWDLPELKQRARWDEAYRDELAQLAAAVEDRYKDEGDIDDLMRLWVKFDSYAFQSKIPIVYKDDFPLNL